MEVEILERRIERVERKLSEIKNMLLKIEVMLIEGEDIAKEDREELERRLKEVRNYVQRYRGMAALGLPPELSDGYPSFYDKYGDNYFPPTSVELSADMNPFSSAGTHGNKDHGGKIAR